MKKAAHILAVVFISVAGFFATPAGHALLQQYKWIAALSALAGAGVVYFNPKQ